MKIKWSCSYDEQTAEIWPPNYQGLFIANRNGVDFYFKSKHNLGCVELDESGIKASRYYPSENCVKMPSSWVLYDGAPNLLVCSENFGLKIGTQEIIETLPAEALERYMGNESEAKARLIEKEYTFGDYTVCHRGQCSYKCFLSGVEQWQLSCRGYLYTEMMLHNGNLFFGTDGNGGHFYVVNLKSGEVVADINTGGTNHLMGEGETRFALKLGETCSLIEVSLTDGSIKDSINLHGCANSYSRIFLHGEGIFVTTFLKKAGYFSSPIISYIDLRK